MPTLNKAHVAHLGREFVFQDRSTMRRPFVGRKARLPMKAWEPPITPLPVDWTGDGAVQCPIDGNDTWGDCGEAMLAHWYQIVIFLLGKGKQFTFDVKALVAQYFRVSGGNNGLEEGQCVQILKAGVGGVPAATAVDVLDVDPTDAALMQFCIDQFGAFQMGWSVPTLFHENFAPGSVWPDAMRPNPRLGHYVTVTDVGGPDTPIPDVVDPTGGGKAPRMAAGGGTLTGFYRLFTWGDWCWVGPKFIASVEPDGFIIFSLALFGPDGLDCKKRHIRTQAALWQVMGGNAIPEAVLAKYPASVTPPADDWTTWA